MADPVEDIIGDYKAFAARQRDRVAPGPTVDDLVELLVAQRHADFISWIGKDGGHRYHKAPGERDRLWILDVDGQTAVIDISWAASAPSAIRDELLEIVDTVQFATQ